MARQPAIAEGAADAHGMSRSCSVVSFSTRTRIHVGASLACGYPVLPETDAGPSAQTTVGTNYFGHWYLTHLLLDPLKAAAPSRVVFVTSAAETAPPPIDWDNLTCVSCSAQQLASL